MDEVGLNTPYRAPEAHGGQASAPRPNQARRGRGAGRASQRVVPSARLPEGLLEGTSLSCHGDDMELEFIAKPATDLDDLPLGAPDFE